MGTFANEQVLYINNPSPSTAEGLQMMRSNQIAIKELEGASAPVTLTIADGAITPTSSYLRVDTEGQAAADDLQVINVVTSATNTLHDGMIVYLQAADSARVVTVKNTSSASGIRTASGSDIVLNTVDWRKFQLRSGVWYEIPSVREDNLVHLTGAETISGAKTFSGNNTYSGTSTFTGDITAANLTATGTVSLPTTTTGVTQSAGNDSTKLATTAFVKNAVAAATPTSMLCNVRTVITTSGTWTVPVTGWYKITCIGGGGAGGSNGCRGGQGGGTTSFGSLVSAIGGGGGAGAGRAKFSTGSGGGGAGKVVIAYKYLTAGDSFSITIGAGGLISTIDLTAATGDGAGKNYSYNNTVTATGYYVSASGAFGAGAGNGGYLDTTNGWNSTGGQGASNGTGFGGGGGGSISGYYCAGSVPGRGADNGNDAVGSTTNGVQQCNGGAGGPGAVILEYFNPAVTA